MKTFLCQICDKPLTDRELYMLSPFQSTITCQNQNCKQHRNKDLYEIPNPMVLDLITGNTKRFKS